MYLDDGLGSHSDKQQCHKISCEVKQDLISSGFVPKVVTMSTGSLPRVFYRYTKWYCENSTREVGEGEKRYF